MNPGYISQIMNSDAVLFLEICLLFEELEIITKPATSKRVNLSNDTSGSLYLTKDHKKQVYNAICRWFSKFNSGNLLAIFRLLVPEVFISFIE